MQKGKKKMESQQESMALSGILGKLRWNHVRNYFVNGPQASVEFVSLCVCVYCTACCQPVACNTISCYNLCKKSIG